MLIRAIESSDAAKLRDCHARCSPETQYRRFFMHKPHLSTREAEYFCNVDMRSRGAVVASDMGSHGDIHGIGQWDRLKRGMAEIALLVEDDLQGLGVGRRLLNAVIDHTRALGLRQLTGSILAGNDPMRRLLETSGYTVSMGEIDSGVQFFSLLTVRGEGRPVPGRHAAS
ncbi:MAG: GNAT family N-acetyltransferase [Solirubrobacterales bacterium]|nr:GNAT family N-acetyltransferase [Solirubrobacterales bacterium]